MPIRDVNNVENIPAAFTRREHPQELDVVEQIRFHLLYLRHDDVGPEWNTNGVPRCDGFHHVHFVCGGSAEVQSGGGKTLQLRPNHAYWLPGHTLVEAICRDHYYHYFLTFRCEWLPGIDLFWDWDQPICLGKWSPEEYLPGWSRNPFTLKEHWKLQTLVQSLFANSTIDLDELIERQRTLHVKFQPIFKLMDERMDARLQVRDLAAVQGMTASAFSRLFREQFGTNPKDYFNRRLNEAACQLLLTTDLAARQIARKLNFGDEYYFNRFFSKINRISPAKYRRQFRTT